MGKPQSVIKKLMQRTGQWLRSLSFRTGVIVLSLCVPCYLLSFVPWMTDMSYALKGALWAAFFGLAKTFQYGGIAILGAEGVKRLKKWWARMRNKMPDPAE